MRRRTPFLLLLLLLLGVLLFGCGKSEVRTFSDDDNGMEINVDLGERFELHLESIPIAGFVWVLDETSGYDLVSLSSNTHVPFIESEGRLGGFGDDVMVFEATTAGAGILRLEYLQQRDDPLIPGRIVEYIVQVDGVEFTRDANDPPSTSTAVAAISVTELLALDSGETTVFGSVLVNDRETRLCDALMESFPPQCGSPSVMIANPDVLDLAFEDAQGIRWTASPVEVTGSFDGTSFTVTG
ncbi:MAG: protease inhibitor I42 family protein [Acidimicrobiales bacterium]